MGRLSYLLARAAKQVARHPVLRAKAAEVFEKEIKPRATAVYQKEVKPRATAVYQKEVKPRAAAAWRQSKPKLDAAKAELRDIAGEVDPRKDPRGFAAKVKQRFFERKKSGG